jgi:hypothetical protein
VDRKVQAAIEALGISEPAGQLSLKGLHRPITTFNVHANSVTLVEAAGPAASAIGEG